MPAEGPHRVLVALGGNAMSAPDGSATEADQIAALSQAAGHIADLVAAGIEVVVTHGNGPQVGNLLVKNELSAAVVPPVSLDWCVAGTQATIGFVLQDALTTAMAARGLPHRTATLVSRTLVDPADPAFRSPDKPVGRYRTREEAEPLIAAGQQWRDFGDRGWRRVVASPKPLRSLDAPTGRTLADLGYVVILSGGGGIPVVEAGGETGVVGLTGVEAVIDKDRAAAVLGPDLVADTLVIATDVPAAVLGFGTPEARPLGHVSLAAMSSYLAAGHFGAGSMGPKVDAICSFVQRGGRAGMITRLDRLAEAVTGPFGAAGTVVTATGPSPEPSRPPEDDRRTAD
jgi:carbamate kinase